MPTLSARPTTYPTRVTISPYLRAGKKHKPVYDTDYYAYCRILGNKEIISTETGYQRTDAQVILFHPGRTIGSIMAAGRNSKEMPVNSIITLDGRKLKVNRYDIDRDDASGRIVSIRVYARDAGAEATTTVVEVVDERETEHGIDHDIRQTPRDNVLGGYRSW